MTKKVQPKVVNYKNFSLEIIDVPGFLDGCFSLEKWINLLREGTETTKIDGVLIVTKS